MGFRKNKVFIFNPYRIFNLYLLFNYRNIRNHFGTRILLQSIFGSELTYRILAYFKRRKYSAYKNFQEGLPLKHVEIETVNRCNNTCVFCPVNKNDDPREFAGMEDDLFDKIINELSELDYSGELALYSNNEPLLDEKLAERIKISRNKCPKAFIYIITNGTLLDFDKILAILEAGISKIVINHYDDTLKPDENLMSLVKRLENSGYRHYCNKITIILRRTKDILDNRAGIAPNKGADKYDLYKYCQNIACQYPFMEIIIRPDGKVSMCCKDALGRNTLGDVSKQTLMEVWNGEEFRSVRSTLINEGRKGVDVCRYCDG